jgi:protein phosphatase-4 regulatory subunit 3
LFILQDQLLLNVIIEELISDKDPELGGAVQLSGVLRLLIDPENMLAALNKSEKADFLNLFYKQSMNLLIGNY